VYGASARRRFQYASNAFRNRSDDALSENAVFFAVLMEDEQNSSARPGKKMGEEVVAISGFAYYTPWRVV
jgi:hypothetical protein